MDTEPLSQPGAFHRRLRLAGALIVLGLLVEIASLCWVHPLAFLAFAILSGGLIAVGVVLYLISLADLP